MNHQNRKKIIEKAQVAKRESKQIDFKSSFDPSSTESWCEILKDLVAMANSGGGMMIFGVSDDGRDARFAKNIVLELDPVKITDQVEKYTGENYSDFEIVEIRRGRKCYAALLVGPGDRSIIFSKNGNYQKASGKQKTAFSKGVLYIRRGASSSPASSNDLQRIIYREVRQQRTDWLRNMRKVAQVPKGHRVHIVSAEVTDDNIAKAIRIVEDADAPAYRLESPDTSHPYRQKDIIEQFNAKETGARINQFDILCVRRVHGINSNKPDLCYKSKFGSRQYSSKFLLWMISEYRKNNAFFSDARKRYRESQDGSSL